MTGIGNELAHTQFSLACRADSAAQLLSSYPVELPT